MNSSNTYYNGQSWSSPMPSHSSYYLNTPTQQSYYSAYQPNNQSLSSSGYSSINSSFNSPQLNNEWTNNNNYYYNQFNDNQSTTTATNYANDTTTKRKRKANENNELANMIIEKVFNEQQPSVEAEPIIKRAKKAAGKPKCVLADSTNNNNPGIDASVAFDAQIVDSASELDFLDCNLFLNDDDYNDLDSNYDDMDDISGASNGSKKKRVLNRQQRIAANIRERKRMGIMNESFFELRQKLPISTGRKRRKMSRLDIVLGAAEYIDYLDRLLKNTKGPIEINFDAYLNSLLDY